MPMRCHDNSQCSDRSPVSQPVHIPPRGNRALCRTERQLAGRADRPLRDPAHAVPFTTAVAIGGAGSVYCGTGMRTAGTLLVDSGRATSPTATDSRQDPSPASLRTPVNVPPPLLRVASHDSGSSWVRGALTLRTEDSSSHNTLPTLPVLTGAWRRKMILKEPHPRAA